MGHSVLIQTRCGRPVSSAGTRSDLPGVFCRQLLQQMDSCLATWLLEVKLPM